MVSCAIRSSGRHFWAVEIVVILLGTLCVASYADTSSSFSSSSAGVPKIFGEDDRQPVSDTTKFPYSAIGQVCVTVGDEMLLESGAMIGRTTVLTCAHGVRDSSLGSTQTAVFIPGKNGSKEPFGRIKVTKIITLTNWTSLKDENYDLALLILESPIGDQTGYFPIEVEPASFYNNNRAVYSAGYPSDLNSAQSQYKVNGTVYATDGNLFLHTIDSEPGQSGSPVWTGDAAAGKARLFGVIRGLIGEMRTSGYQEEGTGVRITDEFAAWIHENQPDGDIPTTQTPSTSTVTGSGGCGPMGTFVFLTIFACGMLLTGTRISSNS